MFGQLIPSKLGGVLPVTPSLNFARIAGQRGCFTFHPVGSEPITTQLHGRFEVAPEDKSEILRDLRVLGVSAATVFPGLAGAADAIRTYYFAPLVETPTDASLTPVSEDEARETPLRAD